MMEANKFADMTFDEFKIHFFDGSTGQLCCEQYSGIFFLCIYTQHCSATKVGSHTGKPILEAQGQRCSYGCQESGNACNV